MVKTYVYDILKRTTQETAAKGGETETRSYEYDGNGNLTGASNGSQYTVTRTYDEMNRTKTKNVPEIGTSKYEYDIQTEEGIAERSTDPSGNAVERVYDKLGRLIRVKERSGGERSGVQVRCSWTDSGSGTGDGDPDGVYIRREQPGADGEAVQGGRGGAERRDRI